MASKLTEQSPIELRQGTATFHIPPPEYLENLPLLHQFLDLVVQDWHRAVESYSVRVESDSAIAFVKLQPAFLKCLFSYVFFFESAAEGYPKLYHKLTEANFASGLKVKCRSKRPKNRALLRKTNDIRDWSIAHFSSPDAPHVDAHAATAWTPMTLSYPTGTMPDLRKLTFGGFRIRCTDKNGVTTESVDLEVEGLDDLHRECLNYLEAYDRVCCEYLDNLREANQRRNGGQNQ
jgi:hypothetical protein